MIDIYSSRLRGPRRDTTRPPKLGPHGLFSLNRKVRPGTVPSSKTTLKDHSAFYWEHLITGKTYFPPKQIPPFSSARQARDSRVPGLKRRCGQGSFNSKWGLLLNACALPSALRYNCVAYWSLGIGIVHYPKQYTDGIHTTQRPSSCHCNHLPMHGYIKALIY